MMDEMKKPDKGFYVFFEVSQPFMKRPNFFNSPHVIKFGWLFFAFGVYKRPTHEIYRLVARGYTYWKQADEYADHLES